MKGTVKRYLVRVPVEFLKVASIYPGTILFILMIKWVEQGQWGDPCWFVDTNRQTPTLVTALSSSPSWHTSWQMSLIIGKYQRNGLLCIFSKVPLREKQELHHDFEFKAILIIKISDFSGECSNPGSTAFFLELCTHGRRGGRAGFFGIIIIAIVIIIFFVINISLIFTTPWITLSGENPRAWAAFLELYVVLTQYLRTNMYISWVSGNLLGVGRWDSAVFQKSSWFFHFQSSLWSNVSEVFGASHLSKF